MHLSPDDLTFLAGFARSAQGRRFVQMLEGRLAANDALLRRAKGEMVFQCQGKSQELEDLIKLVEGAQDSLNRTSPSRSQGTRTGATN